MTVRATVSETPVVRMSVDYVSVAAPGQRTNEDLVVAADRFVLVLDGATRAPGVDTGCIHDVSWLVRQLGSQVADVLLNDAGIALADAVASGIERVRSRHGGTCDLDNPDSPSSTVALVRLGSASLDYLVLADSAVVLRSADGAITAVVDDRLDHLPDFSLETVRKSRNSAGGFWVASTNVDAAYEAICGSAPLDGLDSVALLSDGVTRLAERHGWSWSELLDLLATDLGPGKAVQAVRDADAVAAPPAANRGKPHDDATAVLCRFTGGDAGISSASPDDQSAPALG
ncbi:MAG TPA: protein phosphatase 2C domain-containing protein [Jiangellaceae bacterium]